MVAGRFVPVCLVAVAVGWATGDRTKDQLAEAPTGRGSGARARTAWRPAGAGSSSTSATTSCSWPSSTTIAAAIQTFLPASLLTGLADLPVLSVAAMMGLAVLLSLCSSPTRSWSNVRPVQPGVAARVPRPRSDGGREARGPLRGGRSGAGSCEPWWSRRPRRRWSARYASAWYRMSDAVTIRAVPQLDASPPRRWSHPRLAGAFVLAAWAGLFWFLWLSGRDVLPLQPDRLVKPGGGRPPHGRNGRASGVRPSPFDRPDLGIGADRGSAGPAGGLDPGRRRRSGRSRPGSAPTSRALGLRPRRAISATGPSRSSMWPPARRAPRANGHPLHEPARRFDSSASSHADDTPADEFVLTRYVSCVADAIIASVRNGERHARAIRRRRMGGG